MIEVRELKRPLHVDKGWHIVVEAALNSVDQVGRHLLSYDDFADNLLDCEFFSYFSEGSDGLHSHQLNPLFLIIQKSDDPIADLERVEIIDSLGLQHADNEYIQEFLSDVPIRAIVQVGCDQSYEVILMFVPASHNFIYPDERPDRLLSDDIFAVTQFLNKLRNVAA